MSVEFNTSNLTLLVKTLDLLKWAYEKIDNGIAVPAFGITIDIAAKKASLPASSQSKLNELKRAYSFQSIQLAAQRQGWTVRANQTATSGIVTKM